MRPKASPEDPPGGGCGQCGFWSIPGRRNSLSLDLEVGDVRPPRG